MKNVFLATVATLGVTATAAFADGAKAPQTMTLLGSLEYAVEAETIEASVGAEFAPAFAAGLTVTPMIVLNDDGQDFDFASAEVTVAYEVLDGVSAYTTVETDDSFDYAEATIGVEFRF